MKFPVVFRLDAADPDLGKQESDVAVAVGGLQRKFDAAPRVSTRR